MLKWKPNRLPWRAIWFFLTHVMWRIYETIINWARHHFCLLIVFLTRAWRCVTSDNFPANLCNLCFLFSICGFTNYCSVDFYGVFPLSLCVLGISSLWAGAYWLIALLFFSCCCITYGENDCKCSRVQFDMLLNLDPTNQLIILAHPRSWIVFHSCINCSQNSSISIAILAKT